MIRALFFDSLSRIKWLALSYLCVVGIYSWEKISVFVSDNPISDDETQWKASLMAALCILAVSIISWLIPYDKLTSQDGFWTTKPPRLRHLLTSHSLVLLVTIALPIALSESIISILWGSPITTLSVFLQSIGVLALMVFIIQILATGSRNPFKSIGITVASVMVTLVVSSNVRNLLSPMTKNQHSSLAIILFIVSIIIAVAASSLCIKRKVEWPHTVAVILIAVLFANSESINVRSHPSETIQIEAPPLPYETSIEVEFPNDPEPHQHFNQKDTQRVIVNLGELPEGHFLIPTSPLLVNGRKTPLRLVLHPISTLTGFHVDRDENGGLSIAQDGAVLLASQQYQSFLQKEFQKDPPFKFDTLWIEYELESYKLLTGMAEEHYVKNGILSKFAKKQNDPVTEFSAPPDQVILHATTRPWSDFPSPFHKSTRQRNKLPNPNAIQRIYYIEYQDGSSRCTFPSLRTNNRDSLLPVSWQTVHLKRFGKEDRKSSPITAVYAFDIRHVATWKSSPPIEKN